MWDTPFFCQSSWVIQFLIGRIESSNILERPFPPQDGSSLEPSIPCEIFLDEGFNSVLNVIINFRGL